MGHMQPIFIGLPIRISSRNPAQPKVIMNIPFVHQSV